MRLYRLKYSQRYLCGARFSVLIRSGREAQQKLALRTLFGKKKTNERRSGGRKEEAQSQSQGGSEGSVEQQSAH